MYFVMLGATPKPSHDEYGVTDGAYAACWVATEDPAAAESQACSLLDDLGWDVTEVEEVYPVTRDRYAEDSESLERFDRARVDGIVVTLHTWPVGAPDDDADSDVEHPPERLIFPQGVRFPRPDEFPAQYGAERERLARANVTTGYVLRDDRPGDSFSAFFEANVHAPRLFAAFRDLALAILPDVAAPIVGVKDDEPFLGRYTDRDAAVAVFEPYVNQLQHDGFLEFGVIFQHEGRTEEVVVRSAKYLQVWTNQPDAVRSVLHRHRIPAVRALEFIDEYPMVSESLTSADGNATWPVVVAGLQAAFDRLPPR